MDDWCQRYAIYLNLLKLGIDTADFFVGHGAYSTEVCHEPLLEKRRFIGAGLITFAVHSK